MGQTDEKHADFQLEVVATAPFLQMRVSGALDLSADGALLRTAEPALAEGTSRVELDCAGLTFCDSGGLRELVSLRNRLGADGSMTLVDAPPTLVHLLQITELTARFDLRPAGGA